MDIDIEKLFAEHLWSKAKDSFADRDPFEAMLGNIPDGILNNVIQVQLEETIATLYICAGFNKDNDNDRVMYVSMAQNAVAVLTSVAIFGGDTSDDIFDVLLEIAASAIKDVILKVTAFLEEQSEG